MLQKSGMISILIDGVLQGWIPNSLSLAEKYSASDAFSFVIMLTNNPLTIVTLFVVLPVVSSPLTLVIQ